MINVPHQNTKVNSIQIVTSITLWRSLDKICKKFEPSTLRKTQSRKNRLNQQGKIYFINLGTVHMYMMLMEFDYYLLSNLLLLLSYFYT